MFTRARTKIEVPNGVLIVKGNLSADDVQKLREKWSRENIDPARGNIERRSDPDPELQPGSDLAKRLNAELRRGARIDRDER